LSTNFNNRVHIGISDIQNIQEGNLQTSWGTRVAIKIVSSKIIQDNFLLGVGMGDSMDVYKEYLEDPKFNKFKFTKNVHHLHDQFIQILVQVGIVGFILFLLFFYFLFKTIFRSNNDLIKASFFSILIIFIFSFFTDVPFKNFTAGLFAFIVGYFLNQNTINIGFEDE
jgi:O-antigen ligase